MKRPCFENGEDCAVRNVFATGTSHIAVHNHYDAASAPVYMECKAYALVTDDKGEVQTALEVVTDISEKRTREAEIHRLAFYDPLTCLPNRRLLLDRLEQSFIAGARNGQYSAMLFLDLDHFKALNDSMGHDVGDLLLIKVADRLRTILRKGDTVSRQEDTVSRQGGDEFVLLLKDLGPDMRVAITRTGYVAEKIRASFDQPFIIENNEQHITASIGICLFSGYDITVHELFKYVDTAIYQAKAAGRNNVRFFDPAMQATLEESSALEKALRQTISLRQFQLHYQPQTDSYGRIIGAEALLRWNHPSRGSISPSAFIPLAEETGFILPIGRWVLEEACAKLKTWSEIPAASGLRIAVNVSARQFRQPDFVAAVQQIIEATGANPARLKLELTESLVLTDIADTIAKMRALGDIGIGFSMDDFGTGYSSLSQLKRLPLEQLKIDQSFIRDLGVGPNDDAIVETIIAMGRTMGFNVIAEGVETEDQLSFLIRYGCDAYQGFLFSRPVSAAAFEHLLTLGCLDRK
ncbi:MAG: two-component system response regulator [Deltaproteobacteria bacterium RIFOXYD12_FULL_53_23]|nr:MAG: two-component system response regulator [Deltaproteobacteria bacterium RIFOXYD12_FULL_53_23]